ncbi:uncharacterized protein LOC110977947 [Acanthaster planci]|uniref:Uncharacterized protein LOC110977947 n=1 Tax=Acanthaster planci TaxID=133434 RepID=A0A8B7Y6K2_ACAPL|nr:uncharacterized protein LOC110977947 [Acanthaster planci]
MAAADKSSPAKEGGRRGVVIVLAGHVNMALMLGLQRCCGVLYLSWQSEFNTTARETAAVQSLLSSFSCFSVFPGGLVTRRFGARVSGMIGGLLIALGLFCSCWVSDIKQLYIAATTTGFGLGFSFTSVIDAVATHFKTRYKTAHAVAYSGMGTGIIALPPLLQLLVDSYGWRGAVLILSAIMADIMVCCALFQPPARRNPGSPRRQIKQPGAGLGCSDADASGSSKKDCEIRQGDGAAAEAGPVPGESLLETSPGLKDGEGDTQEWILPTHRETVNPKASLWKKVSAFLGLSVFVKSYRFTMLCLVQTEVNAPYTGFIQFIIPRAESTGVSPSAAAFLISLLGIGGLLGRLGNGLLISWKVSAETVITICFLSASLSSLLPVLDGYAWLAAASFVQGFTVGAFHAIQIVLIRRYVGLTRLVLSTGLCHLVVGIGVLSGPVIAGWLFDVTDSYKTIFYVLAGMYGACALQMLLFPMLKRAEPGIVVQPWDEITASVLIPWNKSTGLQDGNLFYIGLCTATVPNVSVGNFNFATRKTETYPRGITALLLSFVGRICSVSNMAKPSHTGRRTGRGAAEEPPEGGRSIVVVIAAHLVLAIVLGLVRSAGVLYLSWKEDFDTNDKETAVVQSILSSMSNFGCLFGGPLTERFGSRVSGIIGGTLTCIGFFCSCWVTDIVQLYLTMFVAGTGMGICYNSLVVAVAMYFKRKYKVANALMSSGCGTGIMAGPPLIQVLLEHYGWRGTLLIASAIAANIITLCALFRPIRAPRKTPLRMASRYEGETPRKGVANDRRNSDEDSGRDVGALEVEGAHTVHGPHSKSRTRHVSLKMVSKNCNPIVNLMRRLSVSFGFQLLVKSYRFALLCTLQILYYCAYMGFLLYLVPRAQSLGVAPSSAAFLLSILGIGSLLGRLGHGVFVSWKISAEHVTAISMVIAGISLLITGLESYYSFAIASSLHGFVSGYFSAVVLILIRHFVGVKQMAVASGINQIFVGLGTVIGPIVAGAILDLTSSNYQAVFYILSTAYFICAALMFLLPKLKRVEPGENVEPTDV